ncbi:MAG TPA: DUF2231 domain-containing protein [Thermoleophilia bacterium]|nr:DUF2231 domain-containing protein [Thermoleophilia bacterium]
MPLRPALADVPLATLSLAPAFDTIALVAGSDSAGAAGLWTATTGLLLALPTAVAAVLDYLRAPTGSPVRRGGVAHAALGGVVVTLTLAQLVSRRFGARPTPLSLVLSAAAGAGATYSSHLDGMAVLREGRGLAASRESGPAEASAGAGVGESARETPTETRLLVHDPEAAAAYGRLGSAGGDPATLGGDAGDSPDVGACGIVSGAGDCPVEPLVTIVEAAADNPDDFALDEGGEPPRWRRGRTHAA